MICGYIWILLPCVVTLVSSFDLQTTKELVSIMQGMLADENCTIPVTSRRRREILGNSDIADSIELQAYQALYERLRDRLAECRLAQQTTTPAPTPDPNYQSICENAINFTEPYRLHHNGYEGNVPSPYRDYACDPRSLANQGKPWFRFAGAGGERLLNHCVTTRSCGGFWPLWSDDPRSTPSEVGIRSTFTLYGVAMRYPSSCRHYKYEDLMTAIRCSDAPNDYVYHYDGIEYCDSSFCGMRGWWLTNFIVYNL